MTLRRPYVAVKGGKVGTAFHRCSSFVIYPDFIYFFLFLPLSSRSLTCKSIRSLLNAVRCLFNEMRIFSRIEQRVRTYKLLCVGIVYIRVREYRTRLRQMNREFPCSGICSAKFFHLENFQKKKEQSMPRQFVFVFKGSM